MCFNLKFTKDLPIFLESQTYKKISSIEELTDGKYVIAYENMAMENKANGSRIAATAINVTDNAIISPDASIIWEITTTANGMSINLSLIHISEPTRPY